MALEKLNWNNFSESQFDLSREITVYRASGHTPELCDVQVNLENDDLSSGQSNDSTLRKNMSSSTLVADWHRIIMHGITAGN
jgi:hypothetical protein